MMNASIKHILIVDDNLKNLQITAKILKEEKFAISLAQDGPSALTLLQSQIPDLILLDVMMPLMSGYEVCQKIKSNSKLKKIPVIFLTAKNQTEDLIEGFQAGGVDYITKPFKKEELLIRVKNHLELSESRNKIVEMNKTRDKLYSILAHDIRSPLSTISMLISVLADRLVDPKSPEFKEIIQDISVSNKNTLALLENLLNWTKIQSEAIAISPKYNSLNNVLLECILLHSSNAKNKKIQLELDAKDEIFAFFDEVTTHTIFRNLISNAIKFTPENGCIIISLKAVEKYIEISFKDSGIGMPESIIQRIFINDEHYSTLGTNNELGSGLGLYMVKDFVTKNQGLIRVISSPETGTEFIISLPS